MNTGLELWEKVKLRLKENLDNQAFLEIFSPITTVHKIQNNYIYLVVKNDLIKYRIEKFYSEKLNTFTRECTSEETQFKFITEEKANLENDSK